MIGVSHSRNFRAISSAPISGDDTASARVGRVEPGADPPPITDRVATTSTLSRGLLMCSLRMRCSARSSIASSVSRIMRSAGSES